MPDTPPFTTFAAGDVNWADIDRLLDDGDVRVIDHVRGHTFWITRQAPPWFDACEDHLAERAKAARRESAAHARAAKEAAHA